MYNKIQNFSTVATPIRSQKDCFSSQRQLFFEVPADTIQEICDFLGKEDTLNKIFPLCKETVKVILRSDFYLLIKKNETLKYVNYQRLLMAHLDRLEKNAQHASPSIFFPKSYKAQFCKEIASNVPSAVYKNFAEFFNDFSLERKIDSFLFLLFITFIAFDFFGSIPVGKFVIQRIIDDHFPWDLIILSVAFVYYELQNFYLLPSEARRDEIAAMVLGNQEKEKLTGFLEHLSHLEKLLEEHRSGTKKMGYFVDRHGH